MSSCLVRWMSWAERPARSQRAHHLMPRRLARECRGIIVSGGASRIGGMLADQDVGGRRYLMRARDPAGLFRIRRK